MAQPHARLIDKNVYALISAIEIRTNYVKERLRASGFISGADLRFIEQVNRAERDQVRELLALVQKKPVADFEKLKQALIDEGMEETVDRYLTLGPDDVPGDMEAPVPDGEVMQVDDDDLL